MCDLDRDALIRKIVGKSDEPPLPSFPEDWQGKQRVKRLFRFYPGVWRKS